MGVSGDDSDQDAVKQRLAKQRDRALAEKRRVRSVVEDYRASIAREATRQAAMLEVKEGVFVNLADTVIEPTPEWLDKFDTVAVTVRPPDGTARKLATVRRVRTPIVMRMANNGKITEDQAKACLWYREMHEKAGLEGRYSSNQFGPQVGFGSSSAKKFGGGAGHIPMTEDEAYARAMFRAARNSISSHNIKYFESVVLHDVPLHRASRHARCRYGRFLDAFRKAISELTYFCESEQIDLLGMGRQWKPWD